MFFFSRFIFKVIINNRTFPEGRGKTAKEAKQKAAQLAWTKLNDSDSSSQVNPMSSFYFHFGIKIVCQSKMS